MTRCEQLQNLRFLACTFTQDRASAVQTASELGAAVASLNGVLPDDGKAIAFAAAALLTAGCFGMREFSLRVLDSEIRAAFRAIGEWP